MQEKTYEINGKKYTQRPLVLAQVLDLADHLQEMEITRMDPISIIKTIGPKLPRTMAIILIPEGVAIEEKNLDALEKEFALTRLDLEAALAVADDFLSCNRLASISAKIRGIMMEMIETATETLSETKLKDSSKNFAPETLPSEPGSSGM